ncbi:hypothetical protein EEB14_33985 [Rhodococcus sp. WS4]|nr:hypothetical protein EEB14_33985 [Rhodococcus sp. WS4]
MNQVPEPSLNPSPSDYAQIRPRISGTPDEDSEDESSAGYDISQERPAEGLPKEAVIAQLAEAFKDNPEAIQQFLAQIQKNDAPEVEERRPARRADLATKGWRGVLARLGLPIRKGDAEQLADLIDHAHGVVGADLDRPLIIGVTSFKGGCGKTSTTVVLGRLLAQLRGQPILALDTDLYGTLLARGMDTARQEVSTQKGTAMLMAAALRENPQVDITKFVRDAGDGLFVVPGNELYKACRMTADDYRNVITALSQVYPIVLVDMSTVQEPDLFGEVLRSLHALVMVSPPNEDSVGFTYLTKTTLKQNAAEWLNQNRITLINHIASVESAVDTEEFAEGLKLNDLMDVAETPWDRHISGSSLVHLNSMSTDARNAFSLAAAALFDTIQRRDRTAESRINN